MFSIPTELYNTFNDVTYYDVPHKYYLGDKELTSVTTILHKYQDPFKEDYWARKKADEFNLSVEEVKNCWKFINKKGTLKGSIIHDYSENLFLHKVFYYPQDLVIKEFGFDPIRREYEITKKHVDNFYNDTVGKLIPIKTEFIMYDSESLIGGMTDIIFYNVKAKEIQIWDWKTNKDFTFENSYQNLTNELSDLNDCDHEIYSLQLSMYKYIIEKNTGIKLGKSYLVWLSHNNNNYKVIEGIDRKNHINKIIKSITNK